MIILNDVKQVITRVFAYFGFMKSLHCDLLFSPCVNSTFVKVRIKQNKTWSKTAGWKVTTIENQREMSFCNSAKGSVIK